MGVWNPGPGATEGDDLFTGDGAAELANGLEGDDTLNGADGDDTLVGQYGSDWLYGGDDDDLIRSGSSSGGFKPGLDGANHLFGEGGNDTLFGLDGDEIDGGAGDDVITASTRKGAGPATIRGGEGQDTISATRSDSLDAGGGDDRVILQNKGTSIGAGLQGGDGVDTLDAGSYATFVEFSSANGFEVFSNSVVFGSKGSDLIAFDGMVSDDGLGVLIDGGEGADTIRGTLETGPSAGDQLYGGRGGDRIDGLAGDDELRGGDGSDTLSGGEGVDTIEAGTRGRADISADIVLGGAGDDVLAGGIGDTIRGGTGFDQARIDLRDQSEAVVIDIGHPESVQSTGAGAVTGVERVFVQAGEGSDRLTGGLHEDLLFGGAGDDTLRGGLGADVLVGDAGMDLIVYRTADLAPGQVDSLYRFNTRMDRIDLSAVDGDSTQAGRQNLHFIGEATFTETAGEVRLLNDGEAFWQVQIDLDGDTMADFMFLVEAGDSLTEHAFIL